MFQHALVCSFVAFIKCIVNSFSHNMKHSFFPTDTCTKWRHTNTHTRDTQQDICWHFSLEPVWTANMQIYTDSYITFTFSWCFLLQWLAMNTNTYALVDTDRKKHTHTQNKWPQGGPVFLLSPWHSPLCPQVSQVLLHVVFCLCVSLCELWGDKKGHKLKVCAYVRVDRKEIQQLEVEWNNRAIRSEKKLFLLLSCCYLCDRQVVLSPSAHK